MTGEATMTVKLRPVDADAILAMAEWALNHPDLKMGPGLYPRNAEEACRRIEAVADLHRKGIADTLRLREGKAKRIEGTVEVVYADAYDELCDRVNDLAAALRQFAGADCSCYGPTECPWCLAANALRRYEGD